MLIGSSCLALFLASTMAAERIGADSTAGCQSNPRRVERLVIESPGIYDNILVDGHWGESTLVKILADGVTLRHCEIHSGQHNAVLVTGKNVVIESCKIHHVLAGTFADQKDAHGITGHPQGLQIRNCDIGLVSGDAIQFDPGRVLWNDVLVENCTLWTAPLDADAAGFRRGERPGENAVDTKQQSANPRSRMTIRNCLLRGWQQPGQISNLAALNIKNHVHVEVENCVCVDNEICLRLRGGEGEFGGAEVSVEHCYFYDSAVAFRIENEIRDLKIRNCGFGEGVTKKTQMAGGGAGSGFAMNGDFQAPPISQILKRDAAKP